MKQMCVIKNQLQVLGASRYWYYGIATTAMVSSSCSQSSLRDAFITEEEKTKVLPQAKLTRLTRELKKRQSEAPEFVIERVSNMFHLEEFPERKAVWTKCCDCSKELTAFINAAFEQYTKVFESCFKGKDKYSRLQLDWIEFTRCIQFDPSNSKAGEAGQCWQSLIACTESSPSDRTILVLLSSVCRAVFHFCQHAIVHIKEGAGDDSGEEDEVPDDALQDARFTNDEASLYRLGGFALNAVLKACKDGQLTGILMRLQIPHEEKVLMDLPSNIRHLDKGGLTLPKNELLGYLAKVFIVRSYACFLLMYTCTG